MAERVTVEHNGERITLEVPDGTSDEQIQQYLSGGAPKQTFGEQLSKEVSSITDKPTAMGKTTGVTDVLNRGLVAGALGGPVDLFNMGLQGTDWLANKITGAIRPSAVPYLPKLSTEKPIGGSEWFGQQLQNVGAVTPERRPILEAGTGLVGGLVAPVRTATGAIRPLGYEAGAQMIDAGKDAVQAVKPAINAAQDVAMFTPRAIKGALMNEPGTSSSALTTLNREYYPKEIVDRYMKGEATLAEVEQAVRPTQELRNDWRFRAAEKIANKNTQGEPLIPLENKASEAFGERLFQGYKENPLTFAADVGLPALGLPPISPALRGAQLAADAYLAKRTGFAPGFPEKLAADRARMVSPVEPTVTPAPTVKAPTVAPVAPEFANAPKIEIKGVGQNPDVMQMVAPNSKFGEMYASKDDFDKARTLAVLGDQPFHGSYTENGTVYTINRSPNPHYGRAPGELGNQRFFEQSSVTDNATNKTYRNENGQMVEVPPTLKEQLESKLAKPVAPDVMKMETGLPGETYIPTKEIIQDPVMRELYKKPIDNGYELSYTDGNKTIKQTVTDELVQTNYRGQAGSRRDYSHDSSINWTDDSGKHNLKVTYENPDNLAAGPTSVSYTTTKNGITTMTDYNASLFEPIADVTINRTTAGGKKETISLYYERAMDETGSWQLQSVEHTIDGQTGFFSAGDAMPEGLAVAKKTFKEYSKKTPESLLPKEAWKDWYKD